MLSNQLLERASRLSSTTVHEAAGKAGALPSFIKPLSPAMRLCGRALPVRSPGGDNLWLHRAIYRAKPGDVLVVDVGDSPEYGYWGEVMAVAAQERMIAGLVITGGVRDQLQLIKRGFPVCAARTCIRGTGKDPRGDGHIGSPIIISEVTVRQGDLVLGDADGVIVLPASEAEASIQESEKRDALELSILDRLHSGETTIEIYGLPRETAA
jgi:4-hydroxy-4-methyl-2-oxoglutarate aldolase